MSNYKPILPEKERAVRETVDGLLIRVEDLVKLGQYGDAADRLLQAAFNYQELAFDIDQAQGGAAEQVPA